MSALNDTVDIYRAFHLKTFVSCAPGTFSKIDLMLGHKTTLNKFKKLKSYQTYSETGN